MLPTLDIGPFSMPTAGLVFIVGIWLALTVIERAAARLQLHVAATYSLAVVGLAAGFIGARLVFVATHWEAYSENLVGIVWPLTVGFSAPAGLLIGTGAAFFYGRARQLPLGSTLDALAPGIIVGLMTVSLTDFLAGPGFGEATALPWAISLFGVERHPVQLYELAVGALSLGAWWLAFRRHLFAGQLFLVTTIVCSGGLLFVDAFRANAWVTAGGWHVLQIVSLVVLLTSLAFLLRLSPNEPSGEPAIQEER